MATMRYLDLSYEGRQVAERNQLDNGKLPHGSYRGTRKHPPSHLSYDKGREFKDRLDAEVTRLLEQEELQLQGESPSWALLVHKEPSYTDENPFIVQKYMDASKHAKFNLSMPNRQSLLPNKTNQPLRYNGTTYYRPNRMHQYLTATELKSSPEDNVDVKYGRPTRTTLLRARQRSTSASTNSYDQRREFYQRVDELKSNAPVTPSTEYLQLRSLRENESLHSYLTGARYNRAHCLDSKSVEHSGVFMPRQNPAYGMFFRGPKGQEYLQEFEAQITTTPVIFTPPNSARRRPVTAPTAYQRRPTTAQRPSPQPEVKATRKTHSRSTQPEFKRAKEPKLNVVGCGLQLGIGKEFHFRLRRRPETARAALDRRGPLEETYRVNQPPPTPTDGPKTSLVSEPVGDLPAADLDERGAVVADGDEEKENREAAVAVEVPNDARGEVQENVVEEAQVEKKEELEETPKHGSTGSQKGNEDATVEEPIDEKSSLKEPPVEVEPVEREEDAGEPDLTQKEETADEVLEEQAKELVEEVVEKAEVEIEQDEKVEEEVQEVVEEEKVSEEVSEQEPPLQEEELVEPEATEDVDEVAEADNKSVKEVRFFITEEGGGPKEETDDVEETKAENLDS